MAALLRPVAVEDHADIQGAALPGRQGDPLALPEGQGVFPQPVAASAVLLAGRDEQCLDGLPAAVDEGEGGRFPALPADGAARAAADQVDAAARPPARLAGLVKTTRST